MENSSFLCTIDQIDLGVAYLSKLLMIALIFTDVIDGGKLYTYKNKII